MQYSVWTVGLQKNSKCCDLSSELYYYTLVIIDAYQYIQGFNKDLDLTVAVCEPSFIIGLESKEYHMFMSCP